MTTRETQHELYQAIEAHKFDLEITRGLSTLDQEIIDNRIEASQRLKLARSLLPLQVYRGLLSLNSGPLFFGLLS
jgi:hypothetical protein